MNPSFMEVLALKARNLERKCSRGVRVASSVLLFFIAAWNLNSTGLVMSGPAGCQVTTREGLYFVPPSELAGTKSYPTVFILENDSIIVWAVPNRGRFVFKLIQKSTGDNMLLANPTPLPVRFGGVYTFEFGGVYTNFPWNNRDQQPINLQPEVLESSGTCEIRMSSQDPETDVHFEAQLILPPEGPELALVLRLANPTSSPISFPFAMVALAQPGEAITEETEIMLPVDAVEIGTSENNWMGTDGQRASWPAPWSKWGAFQGAGAFLADVKDFLAPQVAVYNPQTDEAFLLSWEGDSSWGELSIFSWGPAYKSILGAYPAFRVELKDPDLGVPAMGEESVSLRLAARKGRPEIGRSGD